MKVLSKVSIICGIILLVMLVCPTGAADDNQVSQYYNEGLNYFNHGQYSEALASLDKAIAIDPYYANIWNLRGGALMELGRNTESLTSYDKALALNQSHEKAWFNRGLVLYRLGRNSDAIVSFDKALVLDPNDADAKRAREIVLNEYTKSTPLIYAPISAIALMVGLAVWGRRRSI